MFFCEKCRYLYNITKDVKGKQVGGKINEALTQIFKKYETNEPFNLRDFAKIDSKDLLEDERFENMTKKEQKKVITTIKAVDKNFFGKEKQAEIKVGSNLAFFICKYCKFSKPIKPGTFIYSKNYGVSNLTETQDYTYAIYDYTLARTKNYICKNPECVTHKNDALKEAVLTKNSDDQIVFICVECGTNWVNSL